MVVAFATVVALTWAAALVTGQLVVWYVGARSVVRTHRLRKVVYKRCGS